MTPPKRILVVDDEASIRYTVQDILADEGYAVATAANGAEALDCVRRQPPDAILLDLMMPVMDGRAFLNACRAVPSCTDVPVVVMSACHTPPAPGSLPGARRFLPKPFDLDGLVTTLSQVV